MNSVEGEFLKSFPPPANERRKETQATNPESPFERRLELLKQLMAKHAQVKKELRKDLSETPKFWCKVDSGTLISRYDYEC